jgi:hypothetical protein
LQAVKRGHFGGWRRFFSETALFTLRETLKQVKTSPTGAVKYYPAHFSGFGRKLTRNFKVSPNLMASFGSIGTNRIA